MCINTLHKRDSDDNDDNDYDDDDDDNNNNNNNLFPAPLISLPCYFPYSNPVLHSLYPSDGTMAMKSTQSPAG
jgi:hypothetical protein